MGKHGNKHNHSNKEKTIVRQKFHDLKKQVNELPRLKNHKTMVLQDLENKKQSTSRDQLIESLNQKLKSEEQQINNSLSYSQLMMNSKKSQILLNENRQNIMDIDESDEEREIKIKDNEFSKKAFVKDLKKVVEASDVVIQVLDARDPLAYRSKELEDLIKSYPDKKKMIMILNKIDLISIENANSWKDYLSHEYPCVLFKANTQTQTSHLGNSTIYHSSFDKKHFVEEMLSSNKAIGGEDLMNILKNYCRVEGNETKKSIVVGIVGFPNVGKSSIINSLKRNKAVGVSSTPGFTKSVSEVILDKNIKLLDSPGVVLSTKSNSLLTNVIRPENIDNPLEVVLLILNKISRDELIKVYNLDDDSNDKCWKSLISNIFESSELNLEHTEKFLCFLGNKIGKFQRGGTVDLKAAAVSVIQDWNSGKLKYMTKVPNEYLNSDINIDNM